MLLCFFSMGIGQLQAQKLFYQSSTGKMPLEVDKSSAIIQFKENTNIQTTLSSLKPSQSLNEVKGHPLNKRAILNFNENQNLTLSQLKDKYFANNNQIESMSYAYQLESGMQVWPTSHTEIESWGFYSFTNSSYGEIPSDLSQYKSRDGDFKNC